MQNQHTTQCERSHTRAPHNPTPNTRSSRRSTHRPANPTRPHARAGAAILSATAFSTALSVVFAAGAAHAQTVYWNGGNASWTDLTNWSTASGATTPNPLVVPGAANTAVFNVTPRNTLGNTISLDAFQFINALTFNTTGTTTFTGGLQNGANPFNFNLGNAGLAGNGITMSSGTGLVQFGDGVSQANDVLLTLSGRQVWSNAATSSASALRINNVSGSNFLRSPGATIFFQTTASARITTSPAQLTNTAAGIIGAWAFTGSGTAARYATNSAGTITTYSGATVISDATGITDTTGTVNYQLATAPTTTAIPGPVSLSTLWYSVGSSATINHNGLTLNGILDTAGNQLTITGPASTIGDGRDLVVNTAATNASVRLNTSFTNAPTGASSLTKIGPGTLIIASTQSQTFTGAVTVSEGRLSLLQSRLSVTGVPVTVAPGATVSFDGSSQVLASLNGSGTVDSSVTFSGSDSITLGSNNASGQFDGSITNSSPSRTIGFVKIGTGLQTFSGVNSYRGSTAATGGVLLFTRPASLPTSAAGNTVVINGGILAFRLGDGTTGFTTAQVDSVVAAATKTSGGIGIDTSNADASQWTPFDTAGLPNNSAFYKLGSNTFSFNTATTNALNGAFTVRAGTLAFTGSASVSQAASASFTVGVNAVGPAAVVYASNTNSNFGNIIVGNGTISASTFAQTGGTITATSLTLNNGFSGSGQGFFNLSGGTFNVATVVGSLQVSGDNGFSVISVTGGTLNASGQIQLTGAPVAGRNAAGRVNQSGGTVAAAGGLVLARTTASNSSARRGEYNLDGGLLRVASISQEAGTDTFGTLNLNGGTLSPTASNTNFLSGVTTANVRNGGARFDTAGFDVTVAQPLLHSAISGDNATDGGLTKSGPGSLTLTGIHSYTGNTTVTGGTLILTQPLRPVTSSLVVTGPGATASLAPTPRSTATAGYLVAGEFASISVSNSGTVSVAPFDRGANKPSVLLTNSLSITGGTLDLGNSDLIIRNGAATAGDVAALVASGALRATDPNPLTNPYTTLAVFPNVDSNGQAFFNSYDGVPGLGTTDLIVKFAYAGDTDLNGVVDGRDVANVIEGLSTRRTGWAWGDADNSGGVITLADLGRVLAVYNASGLTSLGGGLGTASPTGVVPEPSAAGTVLAAGLLSLRRRRR